jgi:sortase A
MLAAYAAIRVHGVVGQAAALEAFEVAQSTHAAEHAGRVPVSSYDAAQPWASSEAPDQSLWGQNRVAAYRAALTAAPETPLAVLEIPKLELRVPVFDGTSELALNRGAGRIEGTAAVDARGNVGLAGHRDGFFRALKDIALGDAIEMTSLNGTTKYRVTELLIVEPSDVFVLYPTEDATLTLVTCYPFYFVGDAPQRFIVKARADHPRSDAKDLG